MSGIIWRLQGRTQWQRKDSDKYKVEYPTYVIFLKSRKVSFAQQISLLFELPSLTNMWQISKSIIHIVWGRFPLIPKHKRGRSTVIKTKHSFCAAMTKTNDVDLAGAVGGLLQDKQPTLSNLKIKSNLISLQHTEIAISCQAWLPRWCWREWLQLQSYYNS